MRDFAKLIRLMLLAQRHTRRYKTGITETKQLEREVVKIVKDILEINELTDEPKR